MNNVWYLNYFTTPLPIFFLNKIMFSSIEMHNLRFLFEIKLIRNSSYDFETIIVLLLLVFNIN